MISHNYTHKRIANVVSVALGVGVFGALTSHAGDTQQPGFTLSPAAGFLTHHEARQGLDDSGTLSLGAGYQFNSPWAAELTYLIGAPGYTDNSGEADEQHLRLDALYHLGKKDKLQPYTVLGAGMNQIEGRSDDFDDSFLNAGVGFKYALNSMMAVRSDVRVLHNLENSVSQAAFNLGFNVKFGATKTTTVSKAKDSDGDGVFDYADKCAKTPPNSDVDTLGCLVRRDDDNDGVPNGSDACPDSEAGAKVDTKGCYETLKEQVKVTLNITFANNSDEVLNTDHPDILALVAFMRSYPESKVVVEGHTDNRGNEAYNQKLSQRRAAAIAELITSKYQIAEQRVSSVGYGETQPIDTNATTQGRANNRRVDAFVSTEVERIVK